MRKSSGDKPISANNQSGRSGTKLSERRVPGEKVSVSVKKATHTEITMNLGLAIALGRRNLKWNRKELAAKAELSASTITRIEKGDQGIPLQTLQTIATALGLKVWQLIIVAESIDEPLDWIKNLQRRSLLALQPYFAFVQKDLLEAVAKQKGALTPAERKKVEAEFETLRNLPGVLKNINLRGSRRNDRPETFEPLSAERIDKVNKACIGAIRRRPSLP